jgi:blue copper oxidase
MAVRREMRYRIAASVCCASKNALDIVTTVHWHGLLVPGYCDGGPHEPINPGATWHPALKVDQPAATLWFHPHAHHETARQTYMGRRQLDYATSLAPHGPPSAT